MQTWLVTGANGFLGSNIGAGLKGKAHLVGMARSAPASGLFDSFHQCDITDEIAVRAYLEVLNPDVVINTAAVANHEICEHQPALAHEINIGVAQSVASISKDIHARFIHISTDAVFDGGAGNYSELDDPNPFSVYGQTKLDGERAVLERNAQALITRTNFFGWSPSGSKSILEFFVHSLREGKQVNGFTDFTVTSIYAQQLVEVLWQLAYSPAFGLIHVGSSDSLSKYEFGLTVAKEFELDASLITQSLASTGNVSVSRARDLSLNTALLTEVMGFSPPTQLDGIRCAFQQEDVLAKLISGQTN